MPRKKGGDGTIKTDAVSLVGVGWMIMMGFVALLVAIATNILYILLLGGIYLIGRAISNNMEEDYKTFVLFLTWILLIVGIFWCYNDKKHGIVPVLRNDATIETATDVFKNKRMAKSKTTLEVGDKITIRGVTRNHDRLKIVTPKGVKGYIYVSNIEDSKEYLFHKQAFWSRVWNVSLSPKERPFVPGRYDVSKGDLVLVLDKAKDKKFWVHVHNENAKKGRGLGEIEYLMVEDGPAIGFKFKYIKNRKPVEFNGGLYTYTLRMELSNKEISDAKEVAPFLHYLGDYVITSKKTFAREDDIEWKLTRVPKK